MSNKIYFIYNGAFFSDEETVISPNNRSFKYGDGCFETMKMIGGEIIFEDHHFERLFSSLQILQFDTPNHFTKALLSQKIKELVSKNNHQSLSRIRLTIFRGDGNFSDDNNTPNYIIQSWALPDHPHYNEKGFFVDIYPDSRKACDAFSNIKSNNYLPYAMASIWCKKKGFDDALILNSHNRITEATTSNLFIIKDSIIKTPLLSEGCVSGVTRKYLLQCFEKESIAYEETVLLENDIYDAAEIFLTNSGFYIQWVKQCGTKIYTNQTSKKLYQQFISPVVKANEK